MFVECSDYPHCLNESDCMTCGGCNKHCVCDYKDENLDYEYGICEEEEDENGNK